MKYAVYVIVIEDTEDNDLAVSDLGVSNMERVGDISTEQEAIDLAAQAMEAIK